MIFVTVGAQLPFDRLVSVVDEWAGSTGRSDVFGQIARGKRPRHFESVDFLLLRHGTLLVTVSSMERALFVPLVSCVQVHFQRIAAQSASGSGLCTENRSLPTCPAQPRQGAPGVFAARLDHCARWATSASPAGPQDGRPSLDDDERLPGGHVVQRDLGSVRVGAAKPSSDCLCIVAA